MRKVKCFFVGVKNFIIDNRLQIYEIIGLIILVLLPFLIDVHNLFKKYLADTVVSPDNVIIYLVIRSENYIISIALFIIGLWRIKSYNKDILMNRPNNIYHRYPYMWYCFCGKVLGIKKCSLENVPIYLQFKLIIHNVFEEFPLDDSNYPALEDERDCITTKYNLANGFSEVNLMLEDTYPMDIALLPPLKSNLPTIKISRNDGQDVERDYSDKFVEKIINEVRAFSDGVRVNVYATTNPMNTMHIARRVFRMTNRGNVKHLYVYQQMQSGNRNFETKGYKIY